MKILKHKKNKFKISYDITAYLNTLLHEYLKERDVVAFDVETTGLDYRTAEIFAYILTYPNGDSEVWRMDTDNKENNEAGWTRLREIFADGNKAIVAHNFKFEFQMLTKHKIFIHPNLIWHDTMLMSRILRNLWPSHSLDYAPWVLCAYPKKLDVLVKSQADSRGGRYDRVDIDLMYRYQITDGERTMILFLTWINDFLQDHALYIDYIVEIELVKTTIEMEKFGIELDWKESNALIAYLDSSLDKLNLEIYEYLGEFVNLNSDIVVRRLFYRKFGFPVKKFTKKSRLPAVDKEVIKTLKEMGYNEPILDMVLKYRTWSNALTLIQGYQEKANSNGIIFPTINTCQAKTRRQSGENPNMQNVSKEEKLDNPFMVPARKCFRTRSGAIMIFVDYSGIEMRLIIDRANSEKMISAMKRGEHPHVIACKIFYEERFRSKKEDHILYDAGKNGHFALPYGCSPLQLGKTLKFRDPLKEGLAAYNRYANEFPEIAYLSKTVGQEVKDNCYVLLPFGSKLYVPISKAYAGLNYLIQGTAALILKRAEIMVSKYFKEVWDERIKLVLPIHDELVIHYPRDLLYKREEILNDISYLMTNIPEINVPLEVEFKKTTSTWNRAKGLQFNAK